MKLKALAITSGMFIWLVVLNGCSSRYVAEIMEVPDAQEQCFTQSQSINAHSVKSYDEGNGHAASIASNSATQHIQQFHCEGIPAEKPANHSKNKADVVSFLEERKEIDSQL